MIQIEPIILDTKIFTQNQKMFAKKFQSILLLLAIVGIVVVKSKTLVGDEMKDYALKTAKEMIERGEKVLEKLPKDDELFSKIEDCVKKFKQYKEELAKSDASSTTENRWEVFIFTLETDYLPVLRQAEEKITPTTGKPTTEGPTTAKPTTAAPSTAKPTKAPTTAKPATAAPSTAKPTKAPTTAKPATAAPKTAKPTKAPSTAKPTAAPTTAKPETATPKTAKPTEAPTTAKPTTAAPTTPKSDSKPSLQMFNNYNYNYKISFQFGQQ